MALNISNKTVLTLLIAFFSLSVNAAEITLGGITYETDDVEGTAKITTYTIDLPADVIIPSEIEENDVFYPIVAIEDEAFKNCLDIASILLPESLATIGASAFAGCAALAEITSKNPTPPVCGADAFDGVSKSTCLVYVPFATAAAYKAAAGWSEFGSRINEDLRITVNGIRYEFDKNGQAEVVDFTIDIPAAVTFPATITSNTGATYNVVSIKEWAFANCGVITSVTIPATITKIGKEAFFGCAVLQTADLSQCPIAKLEEGMFNGCTALRSVTFSEQLTSTGTRLFYDCNGLVSIDLSATGIKKLEDNLFYNCESLSEVQLPAGLTSLGTGVFTLCKSLEAISLPNTLLSVGTAAFSSCGLTTIDLSATSMTTLPEYMFSNSKELESVIIGEKITSIASGAFYNCTGLHSITSLRVLPPACGSDVFGGVLKTDCIVYVPLLGQVYYRSVDQWKDFFVYVISTEDTDKTGLTYFLNGERLVIEGITEGAAASLYTTAGVLADVVEVNDGRVEMRLPEKGVYLVKVGNETIKISR